MFLVSNFVYSIVFFKQKTAYDVRISDWSSDVCSSDLPSTTTTTASSTGRSWKAGCRVHCRPAKGSHAKAGLFRNRSTLQERRKPRALARTRVLESDPQASSAQIPAARLHNNCITGVNIPANPRSSPPHQKQKSRSKGK